jgi:hypothetical protein
MTNQNHPTTPLQLPSENSIVFSVPPTEEVLRLDKEGFHYKSQVIEDAGEAYRLMVESLRQSISPVLAKQPVGPTDEELLELSQFHGITYCMRDGSFIHPMQEGEDISDDVVSFARAVLARWGQP